MMIMERVLAEARPYLEHRTISDAVLGLSLIGIELDDGALGLSYMLRDGLPPGCSVFAFAQELIGSNAWAVAQMAVRDTDNAQRGTGMAVLTAGSRQLSLPDEPSTHSVFGIDLKATDTVGMIGLIPPIAKRIWTSGHRLIVFDQDISRYGSSQADLVRPMAEQAQLLPTCDVVILSGTTLINQTIGQLLDWSGSAREIVMVGSSTPMYPKAFQGTGITILAGSWWDTGKKETLFRRISLAGGISHVSDAMIKKCVRVDG